MKKVTVNAVGEPCPAPVVKADRALRAMAEPGALEVLVDNEVAVQNLRRMASGHHLPLTEERCGENLWAVTLEVTQPPAPVSLAAPETVSCAAPLGNSGLVAAVDTDAMGRGDEALGRTLMKGFLFAVGNLPVPPRAMVFYNGGARLTCAGSDSLEDLKALADKGVDIRTCGTCLNYYGLTEKLRVGTVANMYDIVELLAGAEKVVKP